MVKHFLKKTNSSQIWYVIMQQITKPLENNKKSYLITRKI